MKWTTDKPVKPGWYWYKTPSGFVWMENLDMINGELKSVSNSDGRYYTLNGYDGQWAGPVEPPQ